MVYEAAQAVKIPVIGLGGIAHGIDAAEFLIAGAASVGGGSGHREISGILARTGEESRADWIRFLEEEKIPSGKRKALVGTLKFGAE